MKEVERGSLVTNIYPSGQCPSGYHKISLFIASEKDFHFYRQEDDGMWTHKRGEDAISDLDALGQKIKTPTSSSRQFKDRSGSIDYTISCGEYCAKN